MIVTLAASKSLPKIVVSSLALPMVPIATLKTQDEVSISARLESLESGLKKIVEAVNSVKCSGVRPNQPDLTLSRPSETSVAGCPVKVINQAREGRAHG